MDLSLSVLSLCHTHKDHCGIRLYFPRDFGLTYQWGIFAFVVYNFSRGYTGVTGEREALTLLCI